MGSMGCGPLGRRFDPASESALADPTAVAPTGGSHHHSFEAPFKFPPDLPVHLSLNRAYFFLSLATLTRRSVSPLSGPTPQESVSPMHSVDHVRKSEEPPNPATSANPPATPASTSVSTVSPVSTMGEAPSARRSLASLASLLSSGTLSSRLARCVR